MTQYLKHPDVEKREMLRIDGIIEPYYQLFLRLQRITFLLQITVEQHEASLLGGSGGKNNATRLHTMGLAGRI